jgi:NitT/TauT family transport system ATP-binding protein
MLTEMGNQFLDADINGRKALFRRQLQKLATFQYVQNLLQQAPDARLPRDAVEADLAARLPSQDAQATFDTLVAWARYGELFGFSPETQTLYLDQPGN